MRRTKKQIAARKRRYSMLTAVVLGFLAGVILAVTIYRAKREMPQSPQTPQRLDVHSVQAVQSVQAKEEPRLMWNDAIRQVFPADEAGMMIRICMKENGRQNQYAINWNRNGTYDYSWCQVNSVHKPKRMTDDEWKANLRDPLFNAKEVRRIFLRQGWRAWVVYQNGWVNYGGDQ